MNELTLKYGCNPNQKPSRVYMEDGSDLPFEVLNGRPGYINLMDAFNGWQLVSQLAKAAGKPAPLASAQFPQSMKTIKISKRLFSLIREN